MRPAPIAHAWLLAGLVLVMATAEGAAPTVQQDLTRYPVGLVQAANEGDPASQYCLGKFLEASGHLRAAAGWYMSASFKRESRARTALARAYAPILGAVRPAATPPVIDPDEDCKALIRAAQGGQRSGGKPSRSPGRPGGSTKPGAAGKPSPVASAKPGGTPRPRPSVRRSPSPGPKPSPQSTGKSSARPSPVGSRVPTRPPGETVQAFYRDLNDARSRNIALPTRWLTPAFAQVMAATSQADRAEGYRVVDRIDIQLGPTAIKGRTATVRYQATLADPSVPPESRRLDVTAHLERRTGTEDWLITDFVVGGRSERGNGL